MSVDFIVKLGGAAITHKASATPRLKYDELDMCVQALREAHSEGMRFVVIHGAGSFGHACAAEHALATAGMPVGDARAALGAARTRAQVSALNVTVVERLVAAGVPAVCVQAAAIVMANNACCDDEACAALCARVRAYLAAGLVPVVHGDVVLDAQRGCAIVSGDTLGERLAAALAPRRFVFVTDVDGIYDSDPRQNANAHLLPFVSLANAMSGAVSASAPAASTNDVTGGMRAKFSAAVAICQLKLHASGADGASTVATLDAADDCTPVYTCAPRSALRAMRGESMRPNRGTLMAIREAGAMRVNVRNLAGREVDIEVNADSTVAELKLCVQVRFDDADCTVARQRLAVLRTELVGANGAGGGAAVEASDAASEHLVLDDNARTLASYGVVLSGTIVHLFVTDLRCRGMIDEWLTGAYSLAEVESRYRSEARDLWREARAHAEAHTDEPEWQCVLGLCYFEPRGGVERDYKLSAQWFERAATNGHAHGQDWFGFLCVNGYGVVRDEERAVTLFRLAAAQGHKRSAAKLTTMGM